MDAKLPFQAPRSVPDPRPLHAVERRLVAAATGTDSMEAVVGGLCEDLLACGLPLWRVSLAAPAIDPSFSRASIAWRRGCGLEIDNTDHGEGGAAKYACSPIGWLSARGLATGGWRLDGSEPLPDLPILLRIAAEGATEYILHRTAFDPETAIREVGITFATDRPGGFSGAEREVLGGLVPLMALTASKLVLAHALRETLGTYLGRSAGSQVLAGDIQRGRGHIVDAALLFADLRGFTALTDGEDPRRVVGWLDQHFDALAEPIERHGGEVSKFLGDGFLAVFPATGAGRAPQRACAGALAAAREGLARNDALNATRGRIGEAILPVDIVLHYGPVVAGNIGAGRRLDFTVIGRAVNEASRIERLCEALGSPLLTSDAFARRCGTALVDRGEHVLRGVGRRVRLWSLPRGADGAAPSDDEANRADHF